jgi:hypothetical protein
VNIQKGTWSVVNGTDTQTYDLTVNPYAGGWNLNETKQFWVGPDEGGHVAWRASGTIALTRTCIP